MSWSIASAIRERGVPACTLDAITDRRRLSEKLRDAADAVTRSGRPMPERLRSAYLNGLSGLTTEDFPDATGRAELESLGSALSERAEEFEGEGAVPTTTFMMSEADAEALGARIVALAAHYSEAE